MSDQSDQSEQAPEVIPEDELAADGDSVIDGIEESDVLQEEPTDEG